MSLHADRGAGLPENALIETLTGSAELSRRDLLKAVGVGALALAGSGVLDACGQLGGSSTAGAGGSIKIGFVSPRTGPAAGFGEPDGYALQLARKAFESGLDIGGTHYTVEIVDKDSQSGPASAQAASSLINSDKVDLLLTTSTPETVNPVSSAAEAAGVPCVSTVVPWQAWFLGNGGSFTNTVPFKFIYHFCFGVEQFASAYTTLWPQVPTNKKVGVMWPNDADGNAIRANLGPALQKAGYTIVDPGAYTDGSNEYSTQIGTFIREGCEIFNTFPIPPDFATFWQEAAAQGYKPKIAQIAKTGLFPTQVQSLGAIGTNLASGVYWAPTWPYKSSLTGTSSKDLGSGYEQASGKQWNQQLGASLALFDVAAAVLKASGNPKSKTGVAAAMKTLSVETPIGKLDWGATKLPPNVIATPIIGGQWVSGSSIGSKWPTDFVICENSSDPNVPVAAKLIAYS